MAVDAARAQGAVVARPRPRTRAAASPRRRTAGGVVWIAVAAVLLVGLVAVNVTVLQLNVRLDGLSRERVSLETEIAGLQSQLASAAAAPRIQQRARTEQGLVPADPALTVYVDLRK
jgi:cell division protein FtsL